MTACTSGRARTAFRSVAMDAIEAEFRGHGAGVGLAAADQGDEPGIGHLGEGAGVEARDHAAADDRETDAWSDAARIPMHGNLPSHDVETASHGLPQILQAAQQRRHRHRPDQHIAHDHRKTRSPEPMNSGSQKRHEHGDDGGTLQAHLELAQPVGPETRARAFPSNCAGR